MWSRKNKNCALSWWLIQVYTMMHRPKNVKLISYGLILLSLWICVLMVLARESIFRLGYFSGFSFLLLFLDQNRRTVHLAFNLLLNITHFIPKKFVKSNYKIGPRWKPETFPVRVKFGSNLDTPFRNTSADIAATHSLQHDVTPIALSQCHGYCPVTFAI